MSTALLVALPLLLPMVGLGCGGDGSTPANAGVPIPIMTMTPTRVDLARGGIQTFTVSNAFGKVVNFETNAGTIMSPVIAENGTAEAALEAGEFEGEGFYVRAWSDGRQNVAEARVNLINPDPIRMVLTTNTDQIEYGKEGKDKAQLRLTTSGFVKPVTTYECLPGNLAVDPDTLIFTSDEYPVSFGITATTTETSPEVENPATRKSTVFIHANGGGGASISLGASQSYVYLGDSLQLTVDGKTTFNHVYRYFCIRGHVDENGTYFADGTEGPETIMAIDKYSVHIMGILNLEVKRRP